MISQAMRNELISAALTAMKNAYAPYSDFYVGAALLCENGKIYTGFNIENAAFTPTVCAERAAFTRALCDGERSFCAIAVCGGNTGRRAILSRPHAAFAASLCGSFANGILRLSPPPLRKTTAFIHCVKFCRTGLARKIFERFEF